MKSRPQRMPDGRVIWDGVQSDITARKKMQDALRMSEARLRAIVGTALDGIIVIDVQGVIQSINPAAEQMFGYASAEAAGKCIYQLMPEPYRLRHRLRLASSLNASLRGFSRLRSRGFAATASHSPPSFRWLPGKPMESAILPGSSGT